MVATIERWVAVAGLQPGQPLFRSVKKGGHVCERLDAGGVNVALKARVARYLVGVGYTAEGAAAEAARYSVIAVGWGCTASEAGVSIEAVAAHARHRSLHVAQKYARKADQLKRAPSKHPALTI
jgi:hypothetical protein